MITVDEYLAYCDKALDGYAAIARDLGDDLALLDAARARLHADARAASPREAPLNPPADDPEFDATQGDVLLHVQGELAQHLGQLEVTRDVLHARRP